jgi:hypothetical protein
MSVLDEIIKFLSNPKHTAYPLNELSKELNVPIEAVQDAVKNNWHLFRTHTGKLWGGNPWIGLIKTATDAQLFEINKRKEIPDEIVNNIELFLIKKQILNNFTLVKLLFLKYFMPKLLLSLCFENDINFSRDIITRKIEVLKTRVYFWKN